jgi:hypothetical protein
MDGTDEKHECPPNHLYYCPAAKEVESSCHGGFDTCCDKPELHVPEDKLQELYDRPQEMHDSLAKTMRANPLLSWDQLMEWAQEMDEWATKRALSSDKHMIAKALGLKRGTDWLAIIEKAQEHQREMEGLRNQITGLNAAKVLLEHENARLLRALADHYSHTVEELRRGVDRLEQYREDGAFDPEEGA